MSDRIHPAFIDYKYIPFSKELNIVDIIHPASITKEHIHLYNKKYSIYILLKIIFIVLILLLLLLLFNYK
jgi:hypothetical protein